MIHRRMPVSLSGDSMRTIGGAIAAVALAAVVYLQFSIYGVLGRDPAIYLYGGQRMTHGVPPYASIMDPKGPVSGILCGFGVAVARLLGRDDVLVVRAEFFVLCVASALGVYLLVLELCRSVVAAVVASAVFATFRAYAYFALVGPDGHTPGTVFLVFAMWLALRRRWFAAGVLGSLAFCTWQPLFWVPLLMLGCAAAWSERRRVAVLGCAAGAVTPLVALAVYYAATGHFGTLVDGMFVYPLTGVARTPMTLGERLHFITTNIASAYAGTTVLLVAGLLIVLAAAVRALLADRARWRSAATGPVVLLLGVGTLVQLPYLIYDYIGPSHAYPLLPFAATGFGLLTAKLLTEVRRSRLQRVASAAALTAAGVLVAGCAFAYHAPTPSGSPFRSEQAGACAVQRALVPGTPLWVMGNPIPLVLLHRVNPDNYPYLGSGLDQWKVDHTPGGFAGWTRQITRSRASVVVVDVWQAPMRLTMQSWLHGHGYRPGFIGRWRVYVTAAAHQHMRGESIALSRFRHLWPQTTSGDDYTGTHCTSVAAG